MEALTIFEPLAVTLPYDYTPSVEQPIEGVRLSDKVKPTIEEVLKYAEKQIAIKIWNFARHLPKEQQEEIAQNAKLRLWQHYDKIDPALGWKSFVQIHCQGAAQDYIKAGLYDTEAEFNADKVEAHDSDGEPLGLDETLGIFGVFDELRKTDKKMTPNWDLLSRLAGKDEDLHIICKVLLGYSQESIASQYENISRERISQRIREFMMRLEDPNYLYDKKTNQYIFALGLCQFFNQSETDLGIGWDLKEFDLNKVDSFLEAREHYRTQNEFINLGTMKAPVVPLLIVTIEDPAPTNEEINQLSLFEVPQ